jgi:predicted RNase H-like nuclease
MQALGIDGCRAGWLYVTQDLASGALSAGIFRRIDEILAFDPIDTVAGIDIPIGLTEKGPRPCELEARKLLGRPRASSVFPVPVRPVLSARSYRQACSLGMRADGRKINRQTWNIVPKIREVDAFLTAHPAYQATVKEVHPELCFRHWNRDMPMSHSKKSAEGRADRERLVVSFFGPAFSAARASLLCRLPRRSCWAHDDLLDACAALWTACRIARGVAVSIPADPPRDGRGLWMRITF